MSKLSERNVIAEILCNCKVEVILQPQQKPYDLPLPSILYCSISSRWLSWLPWVQRWSKEWEPVTGGWWRASPCKRKCQTHTLGHQLTTIFPVTEEASLAVRIANLPSVSCFLTEACPQPRSGSPLQCNALHSLAVSWSLRPSTVSIKQTSKSSDSLEASWKLVPFIFAYKMGHRLGRCRV